MVQPLTTHDGKRLFRPAHPAAHEFVAIQQDHEVAPAPEQSKVLAPGHLRRAD
jgi:hypothetical protein